MVAATVKSSGKAGRVLRFNVLGSVSDIECFVIILPEILRTNYYNKYNNFYWNSKINYTCFFAL